MKKVTALILALVMVFTLGAVVVSADEEIEPFTLTYSTHVGETAVSQNAVFLFEDKVNEKLGGDYLTIEYYYSNTLGTGGTMLDDTLTGVTDIGNIMVSTQVSRLPLCALFQTPGAAAFLSCESACAAFHDYYQELQPEELKDLVVLFPIATGPGAIVTKFEAHSMDDLKGHMIRASATTAPVVEAWGAIPVTLDWGDCYEAMRNNLIEGIYTNAGACAADNYDDVCEYQIYAPWYNECELFAISREKFDTFPKVVQDAIIEAGEEVFSEYTISLQDVAVNPFPMFERFFSNIQGIIFFPQEEVDKMTEAIKNIEVGAGSKAAELDEQGLPGTEALKLIKELEEKYNKEYDGSTYKDALLSFGAKVLE